MAKREETSRSGSDCEKNDCAAVVVFQCGFDATNTDDLQCKNGSTGVQFTKNVIVGVHKNKMASFFPLLVFISI